MYLEIHTTAMIKEKEATNLKKARVVYRST